MAWEHVKVLTKSLLFLSLFMVFRSWQNCPFIGLLEFFYLLVFNAGLKLTLDSLGRRLFHVCLFY